MDLKPKGGGLIWEIFGPLYYTLWSLWPKGGGSSDPPDTPGYGPELHYCIA